MPKYTSKQVARTSTKRTLSRPRGMKTSGGPSSSDLEEHLNLVAGLTDPFCETARGARIPDQGASRTVTECVQFMIPIITDAAGNGALAFQPNPKFPVMLATSYDSGTSAFTLGANFEEVTSNTASAPRGRIVTYGIRIISLLSATNASGQIILAKTSQVLPGGDLIVNPQHYSEFEPFPLEHGGEWCAVAHPRGSEYSDWSDFKGTTSSAPFGEDQLDCLVVMVLGSQNAQSVVSVELTMNTEFVVLDSSTMAQYARDQPVYSPQLQVAANHVQSNHSGLIKGAKAKLTKEFKSHAGKAVRKHILPFLEKKALQVLM